MDIYCTRPGCPRPQNTYPDLDQAGTLQTVQQKYCTSCGMPLILVGRYLPTRLLGQGGFGAAFLSVDRYTPTLRQCVVKQFQPSGDLSPDQIKIAQELFTREAEVLEQIGNKHPLIPDLFAFFPLEVEALGSPGKKQELFYLVQEFVDGQDLEQQLEQQGAFSEKEVVEILGTILKVLEFVHQNGTIHRDIKPSNIMRHRNGKLYLLDFGAVKKVTAQAGQTPGKSTGIYSMGFAPPEQMSGGAVYPATDLYALAVTCLTLLTGKQPAELYDSYRNQWQWRDQVQVSDRLATVLDKMLQPTPSQRYPSAQDALDTLLAASSGRSPAASPASAPGTPAQASGTALQSPTAAPNPMAGVKSAGAAPLAQPPKGSAKTPSAGQSQSQSQSQSAPSMSLMRLLSHAAFTGFEGTLLAIALFSLSFLSTVISGGFWLILLGILIVLQYRRVIERVDLIIIGIVTLLVVLFVPGLQALPFLQASSSPRLLTVLLAGIVALFVVAAAIVFRLVYGLLSTFL